MEQIKRANNMWTNDSLFLREYLLIPVNIPVHQAEASLHSGANGDIGGGTSQKTSIASSEIVTRQELCASKLGRSKSQGAAPPPARQSNIVDTGPDHRKDDMNAKDFLSRFDTSFAQIKDKITELEQTTEYVH